MSEGASRVAAEQRAVSRFGDVETIAERLCAARPRRRRRVTPALLGAAAITGVLAFAAGPIADDIAPHRAAAASTVGPSAHGCANAFDSPSNAATRQLVPRANVLRVEIITTPVPSCVIKFQLAGKRVLTFQAPWKDNTAIGFRASIHTPGLVAGTNASWRNGRLTASGLYPDRPLLQGPGPTTATCADAWNASPPTPPVQRQVSTPVVIQALNGGVSIIGSSQAGINGFACTVWIASPKGHTTLIIGAWQLRGATRWRRPIGANGTLGRAIPNADLGSDGKLTLRKHAAPGTTTAPNGAAPPKISHEIGATGWAGGVRLYSTLAQAIRHLGKPADTIRTGFGCQISWPALHLSGLFMFGFVQHGTHRQLTPCGRTSRVVSWTVTDTWKTDRGLRVGASESEVARRYPGSTKVVSLAAGSTTWYLVPRHGSPSAAGLVAVSVGGLVTQLTVTSGSTTFGADVVSP